MKTPLPSLITTIDEAKAFLKALYDNEESFHPDDDALQIMAYRTDDLLFTFEEGQALNALMDQISALKSFDPCEYLLELHGPII